MWGQFCSFRSKTLWEIGKHCEKLANTIQSLVHIFDDGQKSPRPLNRKAVERSMALSSKENLSYPTPLFRWGIERLNDIIFSLISFSHSVIPTSILLSYIHVYKKSGLIWEKIFLKLFWFCEPLKFDLLSLYTENCNSSDLALAKNYIYFSKVMVMVIWGGGTSE